MWQEGQPCAEEGRGPRHALLLPITSYTFLLQLQLITYYPSKWVLPNRVAPARGVHAMPEGGVGGEACTSRLLQLWVPGTPAGAEAIPKRRTASPLGREQGAAPAGYTLIEEMGTSLGQLQ